MNIEEAKMLVMQHKISGLPLMPIGDKVGVQFVPPFWRYYVNGKALLLLNLTVPEESVIWLLVDE